MKNYVFDSYAIIAYLEDENGALEVTKILTKAFNKGLDIYLCVINWGEVYYIALREDGEKAAHIALDSMRSLPFTVIDVDTDLTKQAAQFKATYKMSYADCFAAAVAKISNSTLVTGDPEFKQIEKIISIKWID